MATLYALQLVRPVGIGITGGTPFGSQEQARQLRPVHRYYPPCTNVRLRSASSFLMRKSFVQSVWCFQLWDRLGVPPQVVPKVNRANNLFAVLSLAQPKEMAEVLWKITAASFGRAVKAMQDNNLFLQCAPPVGLMVFAMWGLGPLLRFLRHAILKKDNRHWKKSQTQYIMSSYLRPLLLWIGVITICRAFDPIVLSTEASQVIKQRVVNFVRSLSTVLAFAYCVASLTQQLQKFVMEREDAHDSRNLGVQFIGNAVYSAVWVAAVCLFMELLGFSTQRWLTAGGLGTVLLTLAGREIFTNFLSSIMIHATRPFVESEWIQTKIEGYEVSGTVEHVGWWSPTIIRGDDREAVHIPNHKFTVSVVRNLSQKTHWRIKTHLGISHLDVIKIPNIVSDMRKVLAKHPQVEQKRLHRRVFFDNIDPENQALLILVSCFVRTSHFEEYLSVKEIIMLDLLKVISHHHARLATPIRSVQRVLDDNESRHTSFRDMTSRSGETHGKPFLLIEASSIASGASGQREVEQMSNEIYGISHGKDGAVSGNSVNESSNTIDGNPELKSPPKQKESAVAEVGSKNGASSAEASPPLSVAKPQLEGLDSMGLNSKDITLLGAAFEKPPAKIPEGPVDSGPKEKSASRSTVEQLSQTLGLRTEKVEKAFNKIAAETDAPSLAGETDTQKDASAIDMPARPLEADLRTDARKSQSHGTASSSAPASCKQESDRLSVGISGAAKPQLEENLVLGVALDGPKRTLPLDNEIATTSEQKKLVTSRNGNGNGGTVVKERESSQSSPPSSGPLDVREKL